MTVSHIYRRSLPAEGKPHGSVDILNPPWNIATSAEQPHQPTQEEIEKNVCMWKFKTQFSLK